MDTPSYAHLQTARELHARGQWQDAMAAYRRALFDDPEWAEGYLALGEIHQELGEDDDAALAYEQALALSPHDAAVHYNLGVIYARQHKIAEAIEQYEHAVAVAPGMVAARNNLGTLYASLQRYDDARAQYDAAITLDPTSAELHNNLGALLHAEGNFAAAIQEYQAALSIRPDYAEAMHNLGDALVDSGELGGAMKWYDRVLAQHPDLHYARYSRATVQLLMGDYANGWQGYEARWAAGIAGMPMRHYTAALWNGEALSRGKLLIWGEQGIGDEIMCAGLLPDVIARVGTDCVVECANARLVPLLARSFPNLMVTGEKYEGTDIAAHLPISSLMRLFRNSAADFSRTASPFLIADAGLVNEFRARYAADKKRIGIAWHTASRKAGRTRSIPLPELAPLFAAAGGGVQWVNLQYGDARALEAEIAAAAAPIVTDRSVDQMRDMDRFAAQIAALDCVITIDNTTAHLAGALGIPTFLLLPAVPNWRWLLGRADSPWYPTLRLFRQQTAGDWRSAVREVLKEIFVQK